MTEYEKGWNDSIYASKIIIDNMIFTLMSVQDPKHKLLNEHIAELLIVVKDKLSAPDQLKGIDNAIEKYYTYDEDR